MQIPHEPPSLCRTALVLSAGGMFGAYHAGAWKALAPHFAPDAVVGASVGSLNGWAIAGGIEPDRLIERWMHAEAAGKFELRWPARWRDGLVSVPYLEEQIREMHGHFTPRIPFGVVLTRLRPFGPVLTRAPDVTWRHLASSCSVPVLFPHYRLDGALYTDGGLVQALPLWAAGEFGCGRAIAIHCLPTLPFPGGRMASKLMRAVSRHDFSAAAEMSVLTIAPAEPLGGLRDFLRWKRDSVEGWIERGFLDAEAAIAAHPECFPGNAASGDARILANGS
ncbi:MAG: patatin-like phospholipase family protein [Bryobacterales bacterium]|nr:patatin-like phospholipase family protein [Bryobacterales bacterium]